MEKKEIPFLTLSQLSGFIASKDVSPVEATEAYLDRIEEVDAKLNSYITITRDEALQAARNAEQAIEAGRYLGPMHGVPVAVKDQIYTTGVRTTAGSRIMADFIPEEDATVITNLKRAGAVLLGKLNMTEFATGAIFDHPYGTPRNPWDLGRSPGASSSGSGIATAAFLCATSLGEDTGGSIRGPANQCGVVGLRPTWGRVSRRGLLGASWSMDTVGPISRTVEDCAMTFQAIAGHDPGDPFSWDVPVPDYRKGLDGDIRGVKVGVIKDRATSPLLDPEIEKGVAKAIDVLRDLGAVIEEISIPLTQHAGAVTQAIDGVEWSSLNRATFGTHFDQLDHNNKIGFLTGSAIPAQVYYQAQKLRALLRQQILDSLERVDVLVLPTAPVTARPLETVPGVQSKEQAAAALAGRVSFTGPFNLAGVPALSVPCGFSSENLPMGLQIVGRPFAEETVMKVAYAYEKNTDWHTRKPPI